MSQEAFIGTALGLTFVLGIWVGVVLSIVVMRKKR